MKNILTLICFLLVTTLYAQVGINTTTPNAQLEIKSSSEATPTNTDGILIPKINAFPATNPTAAQQGMMAYLTTTVGVNVRGFYYWDNTGTPAWKPVAGTGGTLDNAYDFGGAGLGKIITADAGAVLINGTDGLVSTGTIGSGAVIPNTTGARMFWYPRKAAFRAGSASGTQWDDANIGTNSVAFGLDTSASGFRATAFGINSAATSTTATAFGSNTTASGSSSTAFGSFSNASGNISTAFGSNSTASGLRSTAFGLTSIASADTATAFGSNTTASGIRATAFGNFTVASGVSSTAFGNVADASGDESTAFGTNTNASGYAATVFGENTVAIGSNATAFGKNSDAVGNVSTSFGFDNDSKSFGETVLGIGATSYTPALNGVTQFRAANANDRLLVVGNAIDANNNNAVDAVERSNALVILKNGNIGLGTSTPLSKVHIVDENVIPTGSIPGNLHVMTSNPQGADVGASITLGGNVDNAASLPRSFGSIEARKYGNTDMSQLTYLSLQSNVGGSLQEAIRLINGRTGLGVDFPQEKLHVVGSIRMVDGTEGGGKVMMSDGAGTGSWQNVAIGNGWGLLGNSAITAANFIGTTDPADDFRFRSRGTWAGMLGLNNTSFGRFSLSSTAGANNTAIGFASLTANTNGTDNIAIGVNSLADNTTGDNNIAIGISSMLNVVNGTNNIAIGESALGGNPLATIYSSNNIAIGTDALSCLNCLNFGFENIAIGHLAGSTTSIGANNILIGAGASTFLPIAFNEVILGNQNTSFAGIQVPWTTTSDHRYKNTILKTNLGLDFINNLNPVFYLRNNDERKKTEYGFIAQELEEALTKFGVTNTGMVEKSKDGMYGVRYNDLFAPIVKSIQELAEENKNLRSQLQSQQATNQSILERLAALEKK